MRGDERRRVTDPLLHDTDAEPVFADFSLDDGYAGSPAYGHGGTTLSILNEAAATVAPSAADAEFLRP